MPSPFPQMFGAPQPDFDISELPEGFKVTRTSLFTKKRNSMTFSHAKFCPSSFIAWRDRGMLIQDAFPDLSPDEREFIQSGATPEEWAASFPPEEEDE